MRTNVSSVFSRVMGSMKLADAFDKPHTSIRCVSLPRGGIASGWSFREIARNLDRAAFTVSREVSRDGGGSCIQRNKSFR